MQLVLALASAFALTACSAAELPQPAVAEDRGVLAETLASLSRPCSGFGEATAAVPSPDDTLFVEVAMMDAPKALADRATLATLVDWARSDQLSLLGAPHVIAKWDQAVRLGLGSNRPTSGPSLMRWEVVPRRAAGNAVLELELELGLPLGSDGSAAPPRVLAFTATARPNEPTLARVVWDEPSQRSLLLLLRTFEVHGEPQLRAIFECKMQERSRWLRQRASDSGRR